MSVISKNSNFHKRQSVENDIRPPKHKYITYVKDLPMTFAVFLSTTGGLLSLWNNLSINDLQVLLLNLVKK